MLECRKLQGHPTMGERDKADRRTAVRMPLNKCLTHAAAVARYGEINFETKDWPNEHLWIVSYPIVSGMFPNWCVQDSKDPVKHILINRDIWAPLSIALDSILAKSLEGELHTFDGCLNIRPVRGTLHLPSTHSYGLALDLNAAENPLGSETPKFTAAFIKCFTDQGFDYGGNFHGRKDPMHFSYAWE
jgi:hypothetical protein